MPAPSSGLTSSLLGTANGLVAYAQGRLSRVDGYIANLSTAVLSLQAPPITPIFPDGASAPAVTIPPAPDMPVPVWSAPGFPTAFTEVLELGDLQVEPFDDDPPSISYGVAPPPFEGVLPDAPGVNLAYDDPTLEVNLPTAPDLLSLQVERFGGMTLPTFDATEPVLTAVEPSIREYTPGSQYTSGLLTELKATLEERVRDGGAGLGAAAEEAIWNRGREREARSRAQSIEALDQMEALGYSFMPGAYVDARVKIMTEADAADRGHSREVMIKTAEMQLDNVKHALTTSVQLESRLIDYTNSVEQRVFDASRYATEAGVQIFNAKVQAFGAMVDVYRAKVGAYEARIRAETAKVDAYRAQIAAEEAKASINRALIEQYKVQTDVALGNIEIFKARVAGIQAKAEIERTKVMVFGEQVRGYTAQVNAYTAGVEGYRAGLQAEQTKAEVYRSQVSAFAARVDAVARVTDARIAAFKGQIDAKNAEYDGYRAAITGESARVEGIARIAGARAEAYRAEATAAGTYNEVLTRQWAATVDQNARIAEIGVSAAKANAELYITTRSLSLDAAKVGAQVAAQVGAAALNAVNFSGSVSSSEGYQASESVSNSTSRSTSDANSNSTNYNYNASV